MAGKRHLEDGVYIRTKCGRYIPVTADAKFTHGEHTRGVCKSCLAVDRRHREELLERIFGDKAEGRVEHRVDGWPPPPDPDQRERAEELGVVGNFWLPDEDGDGVE